MELKLLVIRTKDMQRLAEFYALFGLTFHYHKHGNSPYHYSTEISRTVVEIYPLAKNQTEVDINVRLGIEVDHFEEVVEKLQAIATPFLLEPQQTDFGFMAIVQDVDGRKVEVYKKRSDVGN